MSEDVNNHVLVGNAHATSYDVSYGVPFLSKIGNKIKRINQTYQELLHNTFDHTKPTSSIGDTVGCPVVGVPAGAPVCTMDRMQQRDDRIKRELNMGTQNNARDRSAQSYPHKSATDKKPIRSHEQNIPHAAEQQQETNYNHQETGQHQHLRHRQQDDENSRASERQKIRTKSQLKRSTTHVPSAA